MTARSEVLKAARALTVNSPDGTFSPAEVVKLLHRWGSSYPSSTLRTHVVAAMCVNAPDNHLVKYPDLERVSREDRPRNRRLDLCALHRHRELPLVLRVPCHRRFTVRACTGR